MGYFEDWVRAKTPEKRAALEAERKRTMHREHLNRQATTAETKVRLAREARGGEIIRTEGFSGKYIAMVEAAGDQEAEFQKQAQEIKEKDIKCTRTIVPSN